MDALVIDTSRKRWRRLLALALVFVAVGTWATLRGEYLIGLSNVLFFGVAAVYFAKEALDPRPWLLLDEHGVTGRVLRVGTIEWPDLTEAWVRRHGGQAFLCLEVRDSEKYTSRLSPLYRRLVRLNRRMGFPPLSLSLLGAAEDPEWICGRILDERDRRAANAAG